MENKHNIPRETQADQQKQQAQGSIPDGARAELSGNKGRFDTEELKKTSASALPGAESKENIGTASSGAGLGNNKGTGTRNK